MSSSLAIVSLLWKKSSNVEFYFNIFLSEFHKNQPSIWGITPSREYIKMVWIKMLQLSAREIAHTIVIKEWWDIQDSRMLFFLEVKIYQYFLEYRKEYLSRFRILINDLLG